MCGIVGYFGKKPAFPILIQGLRKVLYRGYDSFGFALLNDKNEINCFKKPGRLDEWETKLAEMNFKGNLGIAHCLPPDTLIQLADGRIVEISKITSQDKVLCLNPGTLEFCEGKIDILKHKSPKYLYKIQTPSVSLITTSEHKMMVYSENEIKSERIKELSKNDLLVFPKKIKIKGKKLKFKEIFYKRYYKITDEVTQLIKKRLKEMSLSKEKTASLVGMSNRYLDHIIRNDRNFREDQLQKITSFFSIDFSDNYFVPQNNIHGKFINLPRESSPELTQIIGYLLGDGTVQPKTIRFKDTDLEVLKVYKELIEKVFNIKGRIASQKETIAYLLEVNSVYLSKWLKENILFEENKFLETIGQLPKNEITAFLRGIFDAEGGVGLQARQIFMGITNEKLAKIIQFLLLRFGILSSISEGERREENWNKSYRISISNHNSIKSFLNYIGFSSSLKKTKARIIFKKVKNFKRGGTRSFKVLPFLKKEIYEEYQGLIKSSILRKFLGHGENLNYFITEYNLISFVEFLKREVEREPKIQKIVNNLEKFLKGEIVFQPIIEKKKIKSPYTYLYDLQVDPYPNFIANCLLSHNCRWATHGIVNEVNAHPHQDCKGNIFLVHNGIIENYQELKEKLEKEGHKFNSECDTEVLCHLIEKYFEGNLEEAVRKALREVRGTYGIAVISKKDPQKIVAARLSSPIILGINNEEFLVASDPAAIITRTKQIINLDDNEIAVLKLDNFFILKEKPLETIEWSPEEAEKGGFAHFMLKEIMEQPESLENSQRGRIILEDGMAKLGGLESVKEKLRKIKRLIIVACGTAYHAGLVGEYILEEYAGIPVEVEIASEFRYKKPILDKNTAVLAISQSGETADTLAAAREAKEKGVLTLGIVNVVGSSVARETEAGVYNHAGPEIGVASTKAFTSQLEVLALLTLFLGRQREMSLVIGQRIAKEISKIPALVREVLKNSSQIEKLAKQYKDYNNFLFLGRKYNFPIALEGALKLKEIAYVNAQGYGAGEMKHGPIALIDKDFPTLAICPSDSVYDKMISNIEEIKARKGKVIILATEGNKKIKELADDVIYIPKTLEMLTPILSVIPLQLFAYYMGVLRGCDVDKPRNLAKAVCVE